MSKYSYSVSELNQTFRLLVEEAPFFNDISVKGEVSNLVRHGSGHIYFSLKDDDSQLNCVFFRSANQDAVPFENGDQITAHGNMTVFMARGQYQLNVLSIEKAGLGALFEALIKLKEKLNKEGLFDANRKQQIPQLPKRIGVITSPTGAVIQDILQTILRRFPSVEVIFSPAKVQGKDAAMSCIEALQKLEKLSVTKRPDVIILARGGGSAEDLWEFNNEALVRAIAACKIPIISAIGHETDTTLCDFAADMRAATPTAAAEISVPEKAGILNYLEEQQQSFKNAVLGRINQLGQWLDDREMVLEQLAKRKIEHARFDLEKAIQKIQTLDPRSLMKQGYTVTEQNGKRLSSVTEVDANKSATLWFSDGKKEVSFRNED